ncbi:cation:proton antiporter [Thermoplasma sp. Kam2015]|uniref:cation:proton antiporter n=1 Tax=Thermoplasma sp. Kam2015 TaxID=2094122 RepID=UPI000D8ADE7D|nr:cation:proton antiporter [Thermoplasma sp. Kam2015]PYB67838.1 cation:proton antiporter [Thermoplasma sp. Kam2015]
MITDILTQILILLSVSMLLGVVLDKFKIPEVVAYIVSGVIVGAGVLKIILPSPTISDIESISLFFIILSIGVEANTEYIYGNLRRSIIFTISGFVIPMILGLIILNMITPFGVISSFVVSLSVSVPSISIISVLLMRYNLLKVNGGRLILSAVVLTDILAFIMLSATTENMYRVIESLGFVVLFFFAIAVFDILIRRRAIGIIKWIEEKEESTNMEYLLFSIVIIAGLLVSIIFEAIGITYVLGSFFAGILIHEASVGEKYHRMLVNTLKRINDSFFIPLFFSIAGLSVVFPHLDLFIIFLPALIVIIASGTALNYLMSKRFIKSITPLTTMSVLGGRGAVGVIIAAIAYDTGIITSTEYSLAILGTVLISLIITPLISLAVSGNKNAGTSSQSGT